MDAAFPTAAYPGYTTEQLEDSAHAARLRFTPEADITAAKMQAELDRRAKRDAGDTSFMTPGERLRFNARKGAAA